MQVTEKFAGVSRNRSVSSPYTCNFYKFEPIGTLPSRKTTPFYAANLTLRQKERHAHIQAGKSLPLATARARACAQQPTLRCPAPVHPTHEWTTPTTVCPLANCFQQTQMCSAPPAPAQLGVATRHRVEERVGPEQGSHRPRGGSPCVCLVAQQPRIPAAEAGTPSQAALIVSSSQSGGARPWPRVRQAPHSCTRLGNARPGRPTLCEPQQRGGEGRLGLGREATACVAWGLAKLPAGCGHTPRGPRQATHQG